jgi:hypothetical protein
LQRAAGIFNGYGEDFKTAAVSTAAIVGECTVNIISFLFGGNFFRVVAALRPTIAVAARLFLFLCRLLPPAIHFITRETATGSPEMATTYPEEWIS